MKHSRGRITSLSDGVFAFAATLMVVDLGTTIDFNNLNSQLSSFISFGIAFFVMMLLWKVHYNFFQRTKYVDNIIISANIVLLFTVLFYLFPLKSLVNSIINQEPLGFDGLSRLFVLYGIGFVLIFICVALLYRRAFTRDHNNPKKALLLFYYKHFMIFVITGMISTLLAILKVGIAIGAPGFVYGTLGITCYINGVKFRKKHPNIFN